jgi:ribosomal protein S18 acetylase RimI-like enzyme
MNVEVVEGRTIEVDELVAGVRRYNDARVGPSHSIPLTVLARSDDGMLIGGVSGRTVYGHFLIEVVWVDERFRGRALGRRLMRSAEEQACIRGCVAAQVDTLSFQAPGFYQNLGFEVVGMIDDFPEGHTRYFMLKRFQSCPAGRLQLEAD